MIYLDYQATTPLAPEAREAMLRHMDGPDGTGFGNPHSPHRMGRLAKAAIETARDKIAALFPSGGTVIFTSGATEALNLAIRGAPHDGPVAYSAIEHSVWVRDGVDLNEVQTGGGQEHGIRSGTLSPALIAGMGAAAQLAANRMEQDAAHVETLWTSARELFSDWALNGSAEHRYKGNLNIRKEGLDVARLMSDCRDIMFSAGSACASGSGRPSHVLKAIGLSDAEAKSSIRLGFGRYTRLEDIEIAAKAINQAARDQI